MSFQTIDSASAIARIQPLGWPYRLSSWFLGDENGQASEALANNNPAGADNRFHGKLYRACHDCGQEVSDAQVRYVGILAKRSLFCHDCPYLEQPESRENNAAAGPHIMACFLWNNKGAVFGIIPTTKQPD